MKSIIKKIIICFAAIILIIAGLWILYVYHLKCEYEKVLLARAVFSDAPIEKKKNVLKKTAFTLKIDFPETTELLFADPIKGDPNGYECVFAAKLSMSIEDINKLEHNISIYNGSRYYLNDVNENKANWLKWPFPGRIWKPEKDSKFFEIVYDKTSGVPVCMIKTCFEGGRGIVYLYYAAF